MSLFHLTRELQVTVDSLVKMVSLVLRWVKITLTVFTLVATIISITAINFSQVILRW